MAQSCQYYRSARLSYEVSESDIGYAATNTAVQCSLSLEEVYSVLSCSILVLLLQLT